MGATDDVTIVQLGPEAAAGGLALSTEARWNQTEADWIYFLSQGTVFGVHDRERLIATAALLPYTADNAWISMVLVTESWRRRGLATRLMDECLKTASRLGVTCWLDATPAGAAVYGPLGFAPTIQLRRLRLAQPASPTTASPVPDGKLGDFITCDISAMGFDRRGLLQEIGGRTGSRLASNGDAMALIRDGRTARHIGPVFADRAAHALAMVRDIAATESGPLLIDAVASQDAFLNGLLDAGWTVERPFQRMRLGSGASEPDELPFAVTGPEYG